MEFKTCLLRDMQLTHAHGMSILIPGLDSFSCHRSMQAEHYSDVRIQIGDEVREFTAEEFASRLGFSTTGEQK